MDQKGIILTREARKRLGNVSYNTLRRYERNDPNFPRPVFLSSRLKGYRSDELDLYIANRPGRSQTPR